MPTKISWCDETINPVVGCSKISAGCSNCYAENMAVRLAAMGMAQYESVVDNRNGWSGKAAFVASELEKPYKWKSPRTIFVSSMGDLFHADVHFKWIDEVMSCVRKNMQHTFIFLTKRPERMISYFSLFPVTGIKMPENLIVGVSVENQETANVRIPLLRKIPAAKIFISLEPMLGPIDLGLGCIRCGHLTEAECPGSGSACRFIRPVDGVILGGESGTKARPMYPGWVRSVKNQCKTAGVSFMFKQWGVWRQAIEAWEPKPFGIFTDGSYYQAGLLMGPINAEAVAIAKKHTGQSYERIHRVGSKVAGNTLDGDTYTDLAWNIRNEAK